MKTFFLIKTFLFFLGGAWYVYLFIVFHLDIYTIEIPPSWEADELGNLGEGGRCGCCGHCGCGQAGRGNSKHGWRIETWLLELEKRVKFLPRELRNSWGS